jgi:hypothetical protein
MKYCPLHVKQQYAVFWNKNELTLEIIEISIVILDKSAPMTKRQKDRQHNDQKTKGQTTQ